MPSEINIIHWQIGINTKGGFHFYLTKIFELI